MADRILQVKLVSDIASINKGVAEVNGKLAGVGSALKGIGTAFVAAFAASEVIAFGQGAVEAASDIKEATSKLQVLLGPHATIAQAFATDAVKIGLSREAALEAQGTFANLFATLGQGQSEAAENSAAMTQLAVDLASFNNTDVDTAIEAIGSALRGESEPIRAFGVLMDDATLKAAALKMGIYDGVGSLTAQQRALAATKVIMEQTTSAQGDFERTSKGLAGQQKLLNTQFENFKATIGEALLTPLTGLATLLTETVIPKMGEWWATWQPVLAELGEKFGQVIGKMLEVWNKLQPAIQRLADFLGPVFEGIGIVFETTFGVITGLLDTVIALLNGDFTKAFEGIGGVVDTVVEGIQKAIGNMVGFFSDITGTVLEAAGNVGKAIFDGIIGALRGLGNAIVEPIRDGINNIIRGWNDFRIPEVVLFEGFGRRDTIGPIEFPDIPPLAKGGIVTGPTLAMIGEAGPEAVIPLGGRGMGGGRTYNITVNVAPGTDPVAAGKAIVELIRQYERRSGAAWRAA